MIRQSGVIPPDDAPQQRWPPAGTEPSRPTLTFKRKPRREFWGVWRLGTSRLRKQHATEEAAWMEARRLRGLFPDGVFYVVKSMGVLGIESDP